ncbi:MAG TPA: bifunctional diaminohydroxyphosphoribosylaminopyrimidine deaminase/5-amino-6-(5-phosphoribosylamino)uracil reductase RibD [Pyrinomonadaceae bacterium]|nr:bifunctional diaminohydroxyphosphoribosylaminopyrimidine deaminase/5-amino-6-(5-phosphoribosylamino)uracil reductase RibD [Pyrinomonadaceae bacterium]
MKSEREKQPETDLKDAALMRRALELGARGTGLVSPNPLVGCVVTNRSGEVVGEGFYRKDQITHAEVIALTQAGERARGGTAYVSLEPHAHHGQTPPCTEALINAGIARVVCPIDDPNPLVSGRGFQSLRNAGIEVVTGVLADEAERQNEKFICWHKKQRPFVHLKLAMSLDGRISLNNSVSTALSGDAARKRVHELRHEHDAILIGGNTAAIDDPSLTDRSDKERRRPLVRVVLDNRLQIPETSKLITTAREFPTLVVTNSSDKEKIERLRAANVEVIESASGSRDIAGVLAEMKRRDLQSVLIEGGTQVAGAFVDARLVDKVTFIYAPLIIGGHDAPNAIGGVGPTSMADAVRLQHVTVTELQGDVEISGYPIPQ